MSLQKPHKPQKSARWAGILLVVLATGFWSTSGLFINLIVDGSGVTPWGLAFWRDFYTFTFLLVVMTIFRRDLLRVKRADLLWLLTMGALSIGFFHVLWNTAVLLNGVAVATVIQSNAPIIVTVMAWLIWREPLTVRKITAIVLAVIGTALISRIEGLRQAQMTFVGLMAGLGAAVMYGAYSLLGKKLSGDYSPWTILVYIFGFGALALLPLQIGTGNAWIPPSNVLAHLAGFVLFTTVLGFVIYTFALRLLQASVASIVATTEVPLAAVASYFVLGQRLDAQQVVGAMLVVGGVVLLSWPKKKTEITKEA